MMKDKFTQTTTERLKLNLIKRVVWLFFGCLASAILLSAVRSFYLVPDNAEVYTRTRVVVETVPTREFLQPLLLLVVLGLIAYGIYDVIRLFMRYRRSQQDDQQMFI
jgi:hypothetical protein